LEAQEYLKKYRQKTITCSECGATFEIQKATVMGLYREFMKLSKDLPDPEDIKDSTQEELAKDPRVLDTVSALLIAGSLKPKISLTREENTLGFNDLNLCCTRFVLQEIIDFSGLSQKADSARILFAKTDPAKIVGMSSLLSNTRPSELLDPQKTLTDYEAASLDAYILIEAKKTLEEKRTPSLDDEIDQKYRDYDKALRTLWA